MGQGGVEMRLGARLADPEGGLPPEIQDDVAFHFVRRFGSRVGTSTAAGLVFPESLGKNRDQSGRRREFIGVINSSVQGELRRRMIKLH